MSMLTKEQMQEKFKILGWELEACSENPVHVDAGLRYQLQFGKSIRNPEAAKQRLIVDLTWTFPRDGSGSDEPPIIEGCRWWLSLGGEPTGVAGAMRARHEGGVMAEFNKLRDVFGRS